MKILYILALSAALLTSCHTINTVLKSNDREYKFEVAKQMYAQGKYSSAYIVLDNILPSMRNTKPGDEALFLAGMCKYYSQDYDAASEIFKRYYNKSYPFGQYVDEARYYSALSYYESTYPVRLDQSATYDAMREIQNALERNPDSKYYDALQQMLFQLQDRIVEKEYLAAKLYFELGDYFLNCLMGGSNYEACVVTAQNAIRDYPYSPRKEDFAILILKAKYQLAQSSVESKKYERYSDTVDEYYGFINEFPQSSFINDAKQIFEKSEKELRSKRLQQYAPDENS
ncbi:MAG: outer membrane protein assembly factor BamD [Bacteroidaceae bacterium]|nr:outer membrane protein assembly factor BamD [Bacteroidaceae bacterium]